MYSFRHAHFLHSPTAAARGGRLHSTTAPAVGPDASGTLEPPPPPLPPSPVTEVYVRDRRILIKRDDLFRLPDSVSGSTHASACTGSGGGGGGGHSGSVAKRNLRSFRLSLYTPPLPPTFPPSPLLTHSRLPRVSPSPPLLILLFAAAAVSRQPGSVWEQGPQAVEPEPRPLRGFSGLRRQPRRAPEQQVGAMRCG